MNEILKICYWCGNTGVTWFNTGDGGEGDWGKCVEHEYRNNEISIYGIEAIKLNKYGSKRFHN